MKTVTTKAIAKVAAVATGLAMATSMLSLAPMAHAASLTSSQVSSILSLLSSFGAGADTIANVNAALTGQPSTSTTSGSTTTTTSACSFSRNLTIGSTGADVKCLQQALIAGGFSIPAGATSYFGTQTRTAVASWQSSKNVAPAVGYFGSISRAAFNLGGGTSSGSTTTTTTTTTTTPGAGTGNGLKVMLAADSPNNVALVAGQAIGAIAKFTFANPTSADIKVTNLAFKRTGISNDATLANVYLYSGATRLTDSAGVSNTAFNFNDSAGLFTVSAGQTYSVSVLADITTGTSGQQVGAQLTAVTSTGTLDSSVVLPITSATQTVSAATLATVDFGSSMLPATNTALTPGTDVTVWQNTVTIGTRAVTLNSFQLQNIGSIAKTDVNNLRLYVDGVQTGSAATLNASNIVVWDLSAAPLRLETGGRVIKVVGDVVGGSSLTFKFSLRRASDAQMVDTDLTQPVLATYGGSLAFTARNTGVQTISSGTVSVVKANASPSSNVSLGASNVKFASYEMRAAGEDIKVDNLDVEVINSGTIPHGLDNGKIFLNGVQVGSTKDLTRPAGVNTATNFTFGSSFILKAGTTAIVDIYADAKTSTGAAYTTGQTAQIRLLYTSGAANGTGQVSLASLDVPGANVDGNALTLSSSTMTLTKYSGYGAQTLIAGAQNVKLGAFTLSAGSTEGTNVNTITVTLSSGESTTITDLMLKDNDTGAQIGSTKVSPSTSNSFSTNLNIAASGTKVINIYGNIVSNAAAGSWIANVDGSGTGLTTGNSVTFGDASAAAGTLQTITVGSSLLTAALGVSPNDSIAIAGTSLVKLGTFNFTSQYSPFTVDKINVKIPANAATSVASVTLKYPDSSGVTQTSSGTISLSSGTETYSTSTFTGLTFYVPAGTTKNLDVYVNLATIDAGATSGSAVSAVLDWDEGFRATDSSGTASTTLSSNADIASTDVTGKGTVIVRKTVPTIAAVSLPTSILSNGSNKTIGKFSITADAAGDVSWGKIAFKINKTKEITIGATSSIKMWQGSNIIAGVFSTVAAPGDIVSPEAFPVTNDAAGKTDLNLVFLPTAEQTVPMGTSLTYELRGTVGGVTASTNNSLDIAIAAATNTTAVTAATGGDARTTLSAATTPTVVWSDRSSVSTVHANLTNTSDWTDEYLVNTLPTTVGNMSAAL